MNDDGVTATTAAAAAAGTATKLLQRVRGGDGCKNIWTGKLLELLLLASIFLLCYPEFN